MVRYVKEGNIFTLSGVKCYAHGCNCVGAMGKGIALQFKMKYPQMYRLYKTKCADGTFTVGDVFEYVTGDEHIYNLGTQKSWKTKAELEAIRKSVDTMLKLATQDNVKSIAMPKIGAGLGGLNWCDVKTVIEDVALKYPDIELVVVENYKEKCRF
ncbi:MAG: macro domain-containing protein [Bacteroides sp.]|nr:macro domain-containing protein [Bacteroides sp.]